MKRVLLTALTLTAVTAFAGNDVKHYNTDNIEQFQYQKGLREGIERGYKEGYRDALEFAKKQLRLYKKKIEALEAGKYLKEYSGKITNPEVYQLKNGDSVKVIVRGCRIEKPLSPDEIIDLPILYGITDTTLKTHYENKPYNSSTFHTDTSDIVGRDGNGFYSNRPLDPYTDHASYIYIRNTSRNRAKLELLNRDFTVEDNRLKIKFYNEKDRKDFLKRFKKLQNLGG